MRKVITAGILLFALHLNSANLDNLKYGPVPYSPFYSAGTYNGKFTVYGDIDRNAEIEYIIFTFTGTPVAEGKVSKAAGAGNQVLIEWNGKNKDGHYVTDGGYIMQIKASSDSGVVSKYLKILVIKDK